MFIPKKDDELYLEPIFKFQSQFSVDKELTNKGFVRFMSANIEEDLKDICVMFSDGFIRNYHQEKVTINGKDYIKININDIISVLN